MCKETSESMDHLFLSLRRGLCSVEFSLQSFWVVMGYVQTGHRLACFLVVLWKAKECGGVENGAYLPLLVLMEKNEQ
jgi:hypothetical protein